MRGGLTRIFETKKMRTGTILEDSHRHTRNEEEMFHSSRNKMKSLQFIINPRFNFDLFYKENMLVKNLSTKYSLVFIFYNWVQASFIYATAKYFVFSRLKSQTGYDMSNFETSIFLLLSVLIVSVTRTILFFIPRRQADKNIKQWTKKWLAKLILILAGIMVFYFSVYLIRG